MYRINTHWSKMVHWHNTYGNSIDFMQNSLYSPVQDTSKNLGFFVGEWINTLTQSIQNWYAHTIVKENRRNETHTYTQRMKEQSVRNEEVSGRHRNVFDWPTKSSLVCFSLCSFGLTNQCPAWRLQRTNRSHVFTFNCVPRWGKGSSKLR